MDPAGPVGLVVAFVAIFGTMLIEGTKPTAILLPGPLVLVWVTTLAVGLAGHTLHDAKAAFSAVPQAFRGKLPQPGETIEVLVQAADKARRSGLLALEDDTRDMTDPFIRSGLQLAMDGTDPDELRDLLEERIASKRTQDRVASKYFADMGGYAPTIGIIGTVISLVHVLQNLSEPATLGESIAAAFVATLWGLLSANVVWLPIATRLRRLSDLQCAQMQLALEGMLAIQAGDTPRLVGERLRSLLPDTAANATKAAGKKVAA